MTFETDIFNYSFECETNFGEDYRVTIYTLFR